MQIDIKEKLPFEDNSIGLINANLSIHYFSMENTIKIFNEIRRVLKPNGLFVGRVNLDKNELYNNTSHNSKMYCEDGEDFINEIKKLSCK